VLSHIVDYGDGSNSLSHWLGRGKRGQRRTVAEPFVAHDVMFGHYLQVVLGMRLCFPMFMAISSEKTSAGWMTQHLILVCIFLFYLIVAPRLFLSVGDKS
jgi:hypothetical protein